mmetsp:Transcript_15960/g.38114  ORF Transcript_15960/g.38114 Transcript_15960/m.38114 type:complete len:254 (+) Transcript_15960:158-919(+)
MASGWAALPMPDSILDKRFLRICTLSSMADLGVTPTRADTYLNGEGHAGYDFTMGWLRNPATTPNAAFVATHPTTYRLTVGFMARQLLRAGWADDINPVRACVELTLQVYNSRLALPNPAVRQFAHTDSEFMAEGFGSIPAPQKCDVPCIASCQYLSCISFWLSGRVVSWVPIKRLLMLRPSSLSCSTKPWLNVAPPRVPCSFLPPDRVTLSARVTGHRSRLLSCYQCRLGRSMGVEYHLGVPARHPGVPGDD